MSQQGLPALQRPPALLCVLPLPGVPISDKRLHRHLSGQPAPVKQLRVRRGISTVSTPIPRPGNANMCSCPSFSAFTIKMNYHHPYHIYHRGMWPTPSTQIMQHQSMSPSKLSIARVITVLVLQLTSIASPVAGEVRFVPNAHHAVLFVDGACKYQYPRYNGVTVYLSPPY